MSKTKPSAQTEDQPKPMSSMCRVRDLYARERVRVHELRDADGKFEDYAFPPGQHIEIPMDIALSLVPNEGFEVIGPDGKVLRMTALPAGQGNAVLKPDQVVATLAELTDAALYNRARGRIGGEIVSRGWPRTQLMSFLLGETLGQNQAQDAPGEDGEAVLEDDAV